VADRLNYRIRIITPQGMVNTFAGSGRKGFADGPNEVAMFSDPYGLAVDEDEVVYVADSGNHRIRKITKGLVSTVAGSKEGYKDGIGNVAQFRSPSGIAVDPRGILYVSDTQNHVIRKVDQVGDVETIAGNGVKGYADNLGTKAQFGEPHGIALDASGNLYVADKWNCRIRKITPQGLVSTVAGSGSGYFGTLEDGPATQAKFRHPSEIAVDARGNLYVSDEDNGCIRKIA